MRAFNFLAAMVALLLVTPPNPTRESPRHPCVQPQRDSPLDIPTTPWRPGPLTHGTQSAQGLPGVHAELEACR